MDITAEMTITIRKETIEVRKGLFGRKTEIQDSGFYSVEFPSTGVVGYNDGDLVYYVNKLQIPITRQMLDNKIIYLKTNTKPDIRAENKGLNLKVK